jgi:hypothetical protein
MRGVYIMVALLLTGCGGDSFNSPEARQERWDRECFDAALELAEAKRCLASTTCIEGFKARDNAISSRWQAEWGIKSYRCDGAKSHLDTSLSLSENFGVEP